MLQVRFYCGADNKTGDVPLDAYRQVLDQFFIGYTEYPTVGHYNGSLEAGTVFEVVANMDKGTIADVAQALRFIGGQDAILVTVIKVDDTTLFDAGF